MSRLRGGTIPMASGLMTTLHDPNSGGSITVWPLYLTRRAETGQWPGLMVNPTILLEESWSNRKMSRRSLSISNVLEEMGVKETAAVVGRYSRSPFLT